MTPSQARLWKVILLATWGRDYNWRKMKGERPISDSTTIQLWDNQSLDQDSGSSDAHWVERKGISKTKEVAMGTKYRFNGKWKCGGCYQSSRFWKCFHPFAEFKMETTEAGIYDWLLSAWQQGGIAVRWLQSWTKVFSGYWIVTGILAMRIKEW